MKHRETEKIYLTDTRRKKRSVLPRIERRVWFWPAVTVTAFLVSGGAMMALTEGRGFPAVLAGLIGGVPAGCCCLFIRKSRLEYFNLMQAQQRVGSVEKELARFVTATLRGLRLPLRTIKQAGEQIAKTAREIRPQSDPQSGLQSGLSARNGLPAAAGPCHDDNDVIAAHDKMLQTVRQANEEVSEAAGLARTGSAEAAAAQHHETLPLCGDEAVLLEYARSLRPISSVDEQPTSTGQMVQTQSVPTKNATQTQSGRNHMVRTQYDGKLDKHNWAMQAGLAEIDSLAAGLLKVARTRRTILRTDWVDVNSIVVAIVAELDELVCRNNVTMHLRDLPCCLADAELVSQAFRAIIENALEYVGGSADPQVRIWGWTEKARVLYSVQDNGIGIEQDEIEKIFEMFYRVDPYCEGHRGLGLAVVRRVIGQHGGRCWVRSVSGKGSTFTIALPLK